MKKLIFCLCLFLAICLLPCVFADFSDEQMDAELNEITQNELSNLDLTKIDEMVTLDDKFQTIFKHTSFTDKVNALLSGESIDVGSFLSVVCHTFFEDFFSLVPLFCTIIVISLLCGVVNTLRSNVGDSGVEKIVNFVGVCLVVVVLFSSSLNLAQSVGNCVTNLKGQMDAVFPVMLTLVASIGGVNSVSVFQPLMAVVSNVIVQIFCYFLLPLVFLMMIFCVINHISSVKLDKFSNLFKSVFKWGSKGTFMLTTVSVLVGGVMAGSFDNLSVKAAHFALKSYVPVLGGVLSDGVNLVAVSGMLIKNAVGIGGIILAVSSLVLPIISVLAFSLGLKLTAAILEISSLKVSNLLLNLSNVIELLITILICVGFMYLISLGILINTANIF